MSAGLRDQLSLWLEWVQTRLRENEAEVPALETATRRVSERLNRAAPGSADDLAALLEAAAGLGQREGQCEILRDAEGNLAHFLETADESADARAELDFVTQSILDAQEEERHRTSIRIHDGPAQSLANVIMRLEFCEKLATRDAAKAKAEIAEVRDELDEVLVEVRSLIFDLRPMTLDDLGLLATLQRFTENERRHLPCDVRLEVKGTYQRFSRSAETHLYRIVQEGLRNAVGHGGPFRVRLYLEVSSDELVLRVSDDGGGFDPATTQPRTGMAEIRRRARAIDAEVGWTSQPGAGCTLELKAPLRRLGSA